MKKHFILHGAMFMAIAVALGALSSHGLSHLSSAALELFQLGVQYQIYHAIGLLAIGLLAQNFSNKPLTIAGTLMFIGIVGFSGGLYFYALTSNDVIKFIIPIGGVCLILSWLFIIWAIFAKQDPASESSELKP